MKPTEIHVGKTYASGRTGVYRRTVTAFDRTYLDGELIRDEVKFVPVREVGYSHYIPGREYRMSRWEFAEWAKVEMK